MGQLHEMALNGMMVGQKTDDLTALHKDAEKAGRKLEAKVLLDIGVAMLNLESAERQGARAANSLIEAVQRFQGNTTVSNAEWLTNYANAVERHAREAQAIYSKIGELWSIYRMTQD